MPRTPLFETTDLQAVASGDPVRAAQLAADLNTVVTGALPCLAEVDDATHERAKALVRIVLSEAIGTAGVQSERRTQGPFTRQVTYTDPRGLREVVAQDLIPQLAGLCWPSGAGTSQMHSVTLRIPGVYP